MNKPEPEKVSVSKPPGRKKKQQDHTLAAWLFLAPALAILTLFTFWPVVCGAAMAFCDYSLLKFDDLGMPQPPHWNGLDNFIKMWHDAYFWTALKHSVLYLAIVPVLQLVSVVAAVLLSRPIMGQRFYRTALYLPVVTSVVVVGIVWKWVLRSDGLLNMGLNSLGLQSVPWLTDPNMALWSVMLVTLWQGIGYYMIMYLAGLAAIDPQCEEAALIDGATPVQVFSHITLPLLKPSLALCSLLSCMSALKVFAEIFVMTGGGPQNGTLTVVYYVYNRAFENYDMGYAAAVSLVLGVVVGFISWINIAYFKEGGINSYTA